MSSITKLPNRRYKLRYRTPDGASRSRTFKLKRQAEDFETELNEAKRTGGYVDRAAGAVTVTEFGRQWIETRRGRDGALLRPRTRALYFHLFARHIQPQLGPLRLRDVNPTTVRTWHAALKGATVPAKSYRLLRAMMNTAVDDEMISRNPCRIKNGGVERSPERPLPTGDEVWMLADAIEPRFRALVLIAAFVGLRWGELAALRRADIDVDRRVVHVERQAVEVDGQITDGPPKTAAGIRTVAMPPALLPEVAAHLENYVEATPDALVFVGAKGARLRGTNFNKVFNKARVKIGRPDIHLHDLRHYANTLAASAGASTRELMLRLGHSSPAASLRYQHATAERDQVLADRMNDLITGATDRGVELRVLKGSG